MISLLTCILSKSLIPLFSLIIANPASLFWVQRLTCYNSSYIKYFPNISGLALYSDNDWSYFDYFRFVSRPARAWLKYKFSKNCQNPLNEAEGFKNLLVFLHSANGRFTNANEILYSFLRVISIIDCFICTRKVFTRCSLKSAILSHANWNVVHWHVFDAWPAGTVSLRLRHFRYYFKQACSDFKLFDITVMGFSGALASNYFNLVKIKKIFGTSNMEPSLL